MAELSNTKHTLNAEKNVGNDNEITIKNIIHNALEKSSVKKGKSSSVTSGVRKMGSEAMSKSPKTSTTKETKKNKIETVKKLPGQKNQNKTPSTLQPKVKRPIEKEAVSGAKKSTTKTKSPAKTKGLQTESVKKSSTPKAAISAKPLSVRKLKPKAAAPVVGQVFMSYEEMMVNAKLQKTTKAKAATTKKPKSESVKKPSASKTPTSEKPLSVRKLKPKAAAAVVEKPLNTSVAAKSATISKNKVTPKKKTTGSVKNQLPLTQEKSDPKKLAAGRKLNAKQVLGKDSSGSDAKKLIKTPKKKSTAKKAKSESVKKSSASKAPAKQQVPQTFYRTPEIRDLLQLTEKLGLIDGKNSKLTLKTILKSLSIKGAAKPPQQQSNANKSNSPPKKRMLKTKRIMKNTDAISIENTPTLGTDGSSQLVVENLEPAEKASPPLDSAENNMTIQ